MAGCFEHRKTCLRLYASAKSIERIALSKQPLQFSVAARENRMMKHIKTQVVSRRSRDNLLKTR